MKNTLLILVLGLFATSCHNEEFPLGPEYGQKWRCVGDEGIVYDTYADCEHYCETACIRFE